MSDDVDVLAEFREKAVSFLDEAKANGVEGVVLLSYEDRFEEGSQSAYARNISPFAAIGLMRCLEAELLRQALE